MTMTFQRKDKTRQSRLQHPFVTPKTVQRIVLLVLLTVGLGFQMAALSTCAFLQGHTMAWSIHDHHQTDVAVGLFRFALDGNRFSPFYTAGECQEYRQNDEASISWQVRVAQFCGVMAVLCASILLMMIVLILLSHQDRDGFRRGLWRVLHEQQGWVLKLIFGSTLSLHVTCTLVWLVRRNDICPTLPGGCVWGTGAKLHVTAQIMHLATAVMLLLMTTRQQEKLFDRNTKSQSYGNKFSENHDEEERAKDVDDDNPSVTQILQDQELFDIFLITEEDEEVLTNDQKSARHNDEEEASSLPQHIQEEFSLPSGNESAYTNDSFFLPDQDQEVASANENDSATKKTTTSFKATTSDEQEENKERFTDSKDLAETLQVLRLEQQVAQKEAALKDLRDRMESMQEDYRKALAVASVASANDALCIEQLQQALKKKNTSKNHKRNVDAAVQEMRQRIQTIQEEYQAALVQANARAASQALQMEQLQQLLYEKEQDVRRMKVVKQGDNNT